MSTAKITSKGQITLPLEVRKRLNLEVGDRVEFVELAEGGYVLKPAIEDVRSLKGMLRKPANPVSTDDMQEAIRRRGSGK